MFNPIKKVLVNYKPPRGIYEPTNLIYRQKYNPSNKKEEMRMERRLKKINRFDDEETGEAPIEPLTSSKAKLIFRMFTDYHNSHRLSRKEVPKEEKAEYIKKCKEFSLYRANEWRRQYNEMTKCYRNEEEMLMSSCLLPMYLVEESLDIEGVNDEMNKEEVSVNLPEDTDDKEVREEENFLFNPKRGYEMPIEIEEEFKENNENIEAIEYTPEYLYLPQIMRVYPDDLHIILKTWINLPAYETSKQGGVDQQGDSMMGGGPAEES